MIELKPLEPLDQRRGEIAQSFVEPRYRAVYDAAADRIDADEYAALQLKWRDRLIDFDPKFIYKYFDVCFWIKDKIERADRLGLFDRPGLRILDLGTGAGHFPAICAALGHEVIGLDVEVPLYGDLARLMKVDRQIFRLLPRQPLPDLGRFDLITGVAVSFDSLGRDAASVRRYWSVEDWAWLILHLSEARSLYPGRLYFELNFQVLADNTLRYNQALLEACARAGADVLAARGRIAFAVDGPIVLGP
ncbi:MAG: class I SAM-dependent methyltransferase [Pseudomonadota bacterium]|nr:class I SAM-dependent methyltransferase [Pseudomonadota bacterium]